MKKAIVTGATGFIGRYLVKELVKRKVKVIAVDRTCANWNNLMCDVHSKYECDLNCIMTLPNLIQDRDIDCIFHLAWQGVSDDDSKDYNIQLQNVKHTLNLIEAAHKMGVVKFLLAGSIHEYEVKIEMEEQKNVSNLVNMYKTAKLAAHWMGKAVAGSYGMKFFCPLIINAYGEGENSTRLINTFVRKMICGESMELSECTQLYDFVYVTDVAKALFLVAEKGFDGKDYIIGSGNPKPLREYLEEAWNIIRNEEGLPDKKLEFGNLTTRAIHLPKEAFNILSLQNDTGFISTISFEEGIGRMVKIYGGGVQLSSNIVSFGYIVPKLEMRYKS